MTNDILLPTYSGKFFKVNNPKINDIVIEDIAHHLSNIGRFTGSAFRFYSVAEHSLMVSYLFDDLLLAKVALLHDSAEAYVGDVISPIKRHLPQYQSLEQKILSAIQSRFSVLLDLELDSLSMVKLADQFALVQEGRFFFNTQEWQEFWEREYLKIQSHLPNNWNDIWYNHFDWHVGHPNEIIKMRFLQRAEELGVY